MERLTQSQNTLKEKPTNHSEQINSIFYDKSPLNRLHQIADTVPYILERGISGELKNNDKPEELIYYCLPTLDHILQQRKDIIDQRELVDIGLQQLTECVCSWKPEDRYSLKQTIGFNLPQKINEFIADYYGFKPSQYNLISLYFHAQKEFQTSYDRKPRNNDWDTLVEIINENLQILSPKKQADINQTRFVKTKNGSTYDLLSELHQKVNSLNNPDIENNSNENAFDQKFLKEEIEKILPILTPIQRRVVEMSYGLNGQGYPTFKEIEKSLGITHENFHLILSRAMRTLRHHPFKKEKLKPFLNR